MIGFIDRPTSCIDSIYSVPCFCKIVENQSCLLSHDSLQVVANQDLKVNIHVVCVKEIKIITFIPEEPRLLKGILIVNLCEKVATFSSWRAHCPNATPLRPTLSESHGVRHHIHLSHVSQIDIF